MSKELVSMWYKKAKKTNSISYYEEQDRRHWLNYEGISEDSFKQATLEEIHREANTYSWMIGVAFYNEETCFLHIGSDEWLTFQGDRMVECLTINRMSLEEFFKIVEKLRKGHSFYR